MADMMTQEERSSAAIDYAREARHAKAVSPQAEAASTGSVAIRRRLYRRTMSAGHAGRRPHIRAVSLGRRAAVAARLARRARRRPRETGQADIGAVRCTIQEGAQRLSSLRHAAAPSEAAISRPAPQLRRASAAGRRCSAAAAENISFYSLTPIFRFCMMGTTADSRRHMMACEHRAAAMRPPTFFLCA